MSKPIAYVGLSLTIAFWGSSFIATKIALRELNPAVIVTARSLIGLLFTFLVVRRRSSLMQVKRNELAWIALLGFLGITFHQWLQASGLRTAAATVTAWVIATIPVFVALLGWALLGERITRMRLFGIGLATTGAVMVVSGGNVAALASGRIGTVGDLLIAASALNWAIFTVLSKRTLSGKGLVEDDPLPQRRVPMRLMFYVFGFGWIFSLPWLVVDGGWRALPALSGQGWFAIVYLGVACSGLAYLFWYSALMVLDATEAGAFLYFEPLVTTVLAGPILGEATTAPMAIGGAAILLGVWCVNRP